MPATQLEILLGRAAADPIFKDRLITEPAEVLYEVGIVFPRDQVPRVSEDALGRIRLEFVPAAAMVIPAHRGPIEA